jgi:hypothetical protein
MPHTASASTALSAQLAGSVRLRSDGMLASSASGPHTPFSQPVRSTSVTLSYQLSLPCITASERLGRSRGSSESRKLLHVEHTARMTPHVAGSHCRSSSTCCMTGGGSSEPHGLNPAARTASTASASASSRAASTACRASSLRCAAAHARNTAARQSSIELGFAVRWAWLCAARVGGHATVSAAADPVLGVRLTACAAPT